MPNALSQIMSAGKPGGFRRFTLILFCCAILFGCEHPQPASKPAPPTVTVAHPVSSDIVEWNEYTGRLKALKTVDARARVGGYLESIHFKDGAIVKKGDLLFVIDPRPFKAALDQAQGQLASAEGKLKLEEWELTRAKQLLAEKAYSEETYNQQLATERQAKGDVEAAKAAVDSAQLNLEFTQVKAPIGGKIGETEVDVGNLISGGSAQSTLLTTIVSLDPIYCYFNVDERTHLKYVRLLQEGKFPRHHAAKFPAWVGLADETGYPHEGYIDFVNNLLDPNTDTITVRALIPNPNLTLTPGLFARVRVAGSGIIKAILIPDEAIISDQSQKIVYTLNKKNVVERKQVKTGQLQAGLRVILNGLSSDDLVIIKGIQRVRPGAIANPKEEKIAINSKGLIPKSLEEFFKRQPSEKLSNSEHQPIQETNPTPPGTGKDGS
jgi:membrane fusion protein, multidrug efflux system